MTDRTILLHCGHPKTGTSFLQSSLALSTERLKDAGIVYPDHPSFEDARKGLITNGNCDPKSLMERLAIAVAAHPGRATLLFSNEMLYPAIMRGEIDFDAIARHGRPEVVLFVRNLFDYSISIHGQRIKGGGNVGPLGQFLSRFDPAAQLLKVLENLAARGIPVRAANYSREKRAVGAALARLIGVAPETLAAPPATNVNRSLSRAETEFLRRLNASLDVSPGRILSDALCNRLPGIAAERPVAAPGDVAAFLERMAPQVDKINALLPAEAALERETPESVAGLYDTAAGDSVTFTAAQLDVLADALADMVRAQLGARAPGQTGEAGEVAKALSLTMRDLALRMDKSADFDRGDALALMQVAASFNPAGQFIAAKVEAWRTEAGDGPKKAAQKGRKHRGKGGAKARRPA